MRLISARRSGFSVGWGLRWTPPARWATPLEGVFVGAGFAELHFLSCISW